mgnify:CR=1 FL=1
MKSKAFIQRNSATVLAIAGAVGVVATVITTTRAAPKALRLLKEAEELEKHELTIWQKMQVVIPVYIPVILTGSATIFCILSSNILNKVSQASLTSAYMMIDQSYKNYQRKLKELYGQEAHDLIIESLAVEKAEAPRITGIGMYQIVDLAIDEALCGPKLLFYETLSERFFESTLEAVLEAEYHTNRNYILHGVQTVSEWYDFLGLTPTVDDCCMGWAPMDEDELWIDFNHRKAQLEDGTEFYIIEIMQTPYPDIDML